MRRFSPDSETIYGRQFGGAHRLEVNDYHETGGKRMQRAALFILHEAKARTWEVLMGTVFRSDIVKLEMEVRLVLNQALDKGYEELLPVYHELQKRTQNSPDAEEAKRAYRQNRDPEWQ